MTEETSRFIEDLNNLLYGFEDYVEADTFDVEKVLELQDLSRTAAPRICFIIRMRLELASASSTASSAVASPLLDVGDHKQDESQPRNGSVPRSPEDNGLDLQVKFAGLSISEQGIKFDDRPPSSPYSRQHEDFRPGDILLASPSVADPWLGSQPAGLEVVAQRPGTVAWRGSVVGSVPDLGQDTSTMLASRDEPAQPANSGRSLNRASTNSTTFIALSPPPELTRRKNSTTISSVSPHIMFWDSAASSASASSSVSNHRYERASSLEAVSPTSFVPRIPPYFTDEQGRSPNMLSLSTRSTPVSSTDHTYEPIEPVMLPPPALSANDGLILVDAEREEPASHLASSILQLEGCTITLNSSFCQYKEFCSGAMEVIHGGLGVKRVKKQVRVEHKGSVPSSFIRADNKPRFSLRQISRSRSATIVHMNSNGKRSYAT